MTKELIIKKIAVDADITVKKAKLAFDSFIDSITESLKAKEKVTFTGFGTFSVTHKPARKGKNPKTMEIIDIPAKNVPVFKAGKTLKDYVK